jgi:hypothetical protein
MEGTEMPVQMVLSMPEEHWKNIVETSHDLELLMVNVEDVLREAITLDATHFTVSDMEELLEIMKTMRVTFGSLSTALSIGKEPDNNFKLGSD